MSRLNAHALFKGNSMTPGFLSSLDLTREDDRLLLSARKKIRSHLKQVLKRPEQLIAREELLHEVYSRTMRGIDIEFSPKFLTQGSYAYGTINQPAYLPPQQIDLDDGMYIPLSVLDNGDPGYMADAVFVVVERALGPLCRSEGWGLKSKETCVRVELNPKAHVDIPIYSIPDREYTRIQEAALATASFEFGPEANLSALFSESPRILRIPSDQVMLAVKGKGWTKSDPREIHNWFDEAVKDHGKVLRRVCRYLKAWRDYRWEDSPLSSITLMKAAVDIFDNLDGALVEERDDLALLYVAKELPAELSSTISSPVLGANPLNTGWTQHERQEIVRGATEFASNLDAALNAVADREVANQRLIGLFGDRFPMYYTEISGSLGEDEVLNYPAASVAAPFVPPSTSG